MRKLKKTIKLFLVSLIAFTALFNMSNDTAILANEITTEETTEVNTVEKNEMEVEVEEETVTDEVPKDEVTTDMSKESQTEIKESRDSKRETRAGPVTDVRTINTGYTYSWSTTSQLNGMTSGYGTLDRIYADNELVTCSDPSRAILTGGGYNAEPLLSTETTRRLARAAAANDVNAMNDQTYAAWNLYQHMVMFGNSHGFTITNTNVPNLSAHFAQFEARTTSYWTKPTFNFGDGTIQSGETKTYNVTNGVTSGWNVLLASQGVTASFSNGVLTVVNNNTTSDTIAVQIVKEIGTYKRASMVYNKPQAQQLIKWGINDPDFFPVNFTNLRKGDLEIIKEDTLGNRVPGVTFDVSTNADMSNPFATITTGVDGKIKEEDITIGDVYIQEKSVVAPLLINTTIHEITIIPNETVTYTQVNERAKSSAILFKEDRETGKIAQGDAILHDAVYELRAFEDTYDEITGEKVLSKDQLIKSETIGTDLTIVVNDLYPARYTFKEAQTATGYHIDPNTYMLDLRYVDSATAVISEEVISYEDVVKGKDSLFKVSTDGSVGVLPFVGNAEFTYKLKSEVDLVGWDNAQTYFIGKTNAFGYLETDYLPYGTYIRRETETPMNMLTAPDRIVVINEQIDEPNPEIVNDAPFKAKVKFVKQDFDLGLNITYDYATFKLIDGETGEFVRQYVGNKYVDELTTTEDGTISAKVTGEAYTPLLLAAGKYEVVEVKVPSGLLELETPVYVEVNDQAVYEVNENNENVITVIIKNKQPKAEIGLTKLFEVSDHVEEKVALFQLETGKNTHYSAIDGSVLHEAETIIKNPERADGLWEVKDGETFVISDLPLSVKNDTIYILREVDTTTGYVLDDTAQEFIFKQEDETTKLYKQTKEFENKLIRTDIELAKVDEYTNEIILGLEGFEFTAEFVFNGELITVVEVVNPETGLVTFTDVPYGVNLRIYETSTNNKYYLSDEEVEITVDENLDGIGDVYTFTYTNQPKPTIGTTATGLNGEKVFDPTIDNELVDVIAYEDIDISEEYAVRTVAVSDRVIALIAETAGKEYSLLSEAEIKEALAIVLEKHPELIKVDKTVENVTFDEKDGEYSVFVTLPANSMEDGEGLVFFEYFYFQKDYTPEGANIPVVEHEDPIDPGQTVTAEAPEFTIEANKVDSVTKENIKSKDFVFEFIGYKNGEKVESFKIAGDPLTGIATFKFKGAGTYDYVEIIESEAPIGYLLSKEVKVVTMDMFNESNVYSFEYINVLKPAAAVASGDTSQTNTFIGILVLSLGVIIITSKRFGKVKG